jgi:hypothetical protein
MKKRTLGRKGWITWSLSKMGVMIAVSVLILMLLVVYRYVSCVSASDSANLAAENLAGTIATVYSGPVGLETEYPLPNRIENRKYEMAIAPGASGIIVNITGTRCGTSTGGSALNPVVSSYPRPLKNETEENVILIIQNTAAGVKIGKKDKCAGCIKLSSFDYDGENGCDDPAEESVSFVNTCMGECDLSSWTVEDRKSHVYSFPHYVLPAGADVSIYTCCGTDTATQLFWCYSPPAYICKAIWNNDGDTLYLKDESGLLVLEYAYPEAAP